MNAKELSLIPKLIDCITLHNLNRSFGNIAYYLLLHYNSLEDISVKKITDDCFVSPSSVRRFCQSIGYANYSDLVDAKAQNPENQQTIAFDNWAKGRYSPHTLHQEIMNITYSLYRTASKDVLTGLAEDIVRHNNVILFCFRPYSLWLREFQNQMLAMGKPLYILEEIHLWQHVIDKMEGDICSIVVSPAAQVITALGQDIEYVPGTKTLIACEKKLGEEEYRTHLDLYNRILSIRFATNDFDYLEIYGKYAVSFLFEILLGEICKLKRHEA